MEVTPAVCDSNSKDSNWDLWEEILPGGKQTDAGPLASGALVETCIPFWA